MVENKALAKSSTSLIHLFVQVLLDIPVSGRIKQGAKENVVSVFRFGLAAGYKTSKQKTLPRGCNRVRGHKICSGELGKLQLR